MVHGWGGLVEREREKERECEKWGMGRLKQELGFKVTVCVFLVVFTKSINITLEKKLVLKQISLRNE